MKKFFYLLFLPIAFASCKNAETNSSCEDCETFTGDFLYLDDAAVLKGDSFIYAVQMDSQAEALAKKTDLIKKDAYDMVEVTVKGILTKRAENEEGWDEILSIKEIITIADEPSEADILIQQ